ncbi:MAG TPA: HAD family hydrolase [Longimicrobiales bacterium]
MIILFDLDGTLIATRRLYLECYRRALAPRVGRELSDDELLAYKPRSEIRLLQAIAGEAAIAECLADFHRHYEALHDELFQGVYPGIPELLTSLRQRRHPVGVVTGKSRRSWEITLARAQLGPFDVVVLDDDVSAPKPDPEGILLALQHLRAEPERALYVGDSIGDVLAARAAGVRPAAVLWSKREEERDSFAERARNEGALLLREPAELLAIL